MHMRSHMVLLWFPQKYIYWLLESAILIQCARSSKNYSYQASKLAFSTCMQAHNSTCKTKQKWQTCWRKNRLCWVRSLKAHFSLKMTLGSSTILLWTKKVTPCNFWTLTKYLSKIVRLVGTVKSTLILRQLSSRSRTALSPKVNANWLQQDRLTFACMASLSKTLQTSLWEVMPSLAQAAPIYRSTARHFRIFVDREALVYTLKIRWMVSLRSLAATLRTIAQPNKLGLLNSMRQVQFCSETIHLPSIQ